MRFERWELDPVGRVLTVGGQPVDVGSRAFDVLLTLVERRGQAVSKRQLLESAWGELAVEENNVSVQISNLRKVLGADAIATIPAIGYRLTALPMTEPARAAPPRVAAVQGVVKPQARHAGADPAADAGLIGREADTKAVVERLRAARLVSIVGTGGVGKTSLARAVLGVCATDLAPEAHWVDLSSLRDGSQFIPALAQALAVDIEADATAGGALVQALTRLQVLVVLDNCEHLQPAVAAFLASALPGAPGLRWLVTSQQPLQLVDEVVYRLAPLAVPAETADLPAALAHGAVALLCRLAAAADQHFSLTPDNLPMAVDLCRQLDGLPLAIEMAASRMSTLGLAGVHAQLDRRLRLLAGHRTGPARHHTLRSTLDWSHGLLSAVEQTVLRRLQPFVGGFQIQMACRLVTRIDSAVGPDSSAPIDEWDALEALSGLVHKSFIQRMPKPGDRHRLLEGTRSYAAEHLAAAHEQDCAQRCHALVLADAMRSAQADFMRLSDADWGERYLPERANVLQALNWACTVDDPDTLAILAAAAAQMDAFTQTQPEIVRLGIPLPVLARAQPALRAAAYLEISWAHYAAGHRELGTQLASLALADCVQTGDVAGQYRALSQLIRLYESRPGTLALAQDMEARRRLIDVGLLPLRTRLTAEIAGGLHYEGQRAGSRLQTLQAMADRAGYATLSAICRVRMADTMLVDRQFQAAAEQARAFVAAGAWRPRLKGLMLCIETLALVQLDRLEAARASAREALRALPGAAYLVATCFSLAAARHGRWADAAMLGGHASTVRLGLDERPDPGEAAAIDETMACLQRQLSPLELTELMQVGAALSTRDAMALALQDWPGSAG